MTLVRLPMRDTLVELLNVPQRVSWKDLKVSREFMNF